MRFPTYIFVFVGNFCYINYSLKLNIMLQFLLIFTLCMSILNLLKESVRIIHAFRNEQKYRTTNVNTIFLFASISAIIAIICVL